MTTTQIQQWARESGFRVKNFIPPVITAQHSNGSWISVGDELEAFAALARADLEAENEKLRNHIKHIGNDALRGENASLKAEVESLREQVRKEQMHVQELAADAARYQALRDSGYMPAEEFTKQCDAAIGKTK